MTIAADKVHTAGYDLDGDGNEGGDFKFGAAAVDRFFRYFGDSNGDRMVDTADLTLFRKALGKSSSQPGYLSYFDYLAEGGVDSTVDYAQFLIRYRLRYLSPAGGRPTIAVVR